LKTKIAVIGSAEFFERIQSVASSVNEIELDGYIYQDPMQSSSLIESLKPCDVVFFSGALPYYFSKTERERLPVPTLYLAQDELTISSSLLSAIYHKQITLERISIDLIDSSIVTNVLASVDIETSPKHVIDYGAMLITDTFDLLKIISFHHSLWKERKIDLAITSIHAVYNQLVLLGIPAMRMADPKTALIRRLQEAKSLALYTKSQSAQVAVGYLSSSKLQEKENQKFIQAFVHAIHASVQQLSPSSYSFYSTRGDIEGLIGQERLLQYFSDFTDLSIGFGYGSTIMEADQNALAALSFAEKDLKETCMYILTNDKKLLGPYPQERKQQRLKNDHPQLLEIAQKAKISPANLSKLIQFGKERQSHHFTAADLSDFLQVTRRTTERIIKKLANHGYIRTIGEEMTYQQGRPRAVYILNLPIYQ
jgi:hypothetical protein